MCKLHLDADQESELLVENHVPAENCACSLSFLISVLNHVLSNHSDGALPAELQALYQSLQKCLDLRDKYMCLSKQRLGDNPRDRDDAFTGIDEELQGVSGIRPDANLTSLSNKTMSANSQLATKNEKPWQIYPKPPPPHWHWKAKKSSITGEDGLAGIPESIDKSQSDEEEFEFSQCEMPGADEEDRWFRLDERGVYQVYAGPGASSLCCSSLSRHVVTRL